MSIQKLLVYVIATLPLIFFPPSFNPYELPKFIVFIAAVEIIAILFIFQNKKFLSVKSFFARDSLHTVIVLYLCVVFVADIFGIDPKISLIGSMYRHQGFVTLLAGVILFLVLSQQKKHTAHQLAQGIIVSGVLVSFIGLFQAVFAFIFHNPDIPFYQGRIVGTMGNPNFLGGYLAMVLPFVLWRDDEIRPLNQAKVPFYNKLVYYTALVMKNRFALRTILVGMIVGATFVSGSRSAFLAEIVIFLVWLVHVFHFTPSGWFSFTPSRWKAKPGWKVKSTRIGSTILIVSTLSITLWFLFQHFDTALYQSSLIGRYSYWDNRQLIWSEGFRGFLERPLFGYGQENFELVFPQERSFKVDSAHNIFLEVAVASGVAGLTFFIAILFLAIRQAKMPVRMGIIALLIVAQFNPLSISQLALFWCMLSFSYRSNKTTVVE